MAAPSASGLAVTMGGASVTVAPTRAEYAAIARRLTADLAQLRAHVEVRAGAANAALLHGDAAGALHRMLAAAGAYETGGGDAR